MKAFSTIVEAVNQDGKIEIFDGPPVFAHDEESARKELKRLFPYAKLLEEDVNMIKMSNKLFNDVD